MTRVTTSRVLWCVLLYMSVIATVQADGSVLQLVLLVPGTFTVGWMLFPVWKRS